MVIERLQLRPLRPDDDDAVESWFAGLSEDSRWLRFLSPMPRLPATTRRLLLADRRSGRQGVVAALRYPALRHPALRHPALAGLRLFRSQIVGIAHLTLLDDVRGEVAIAVADAWHGQGIGRRLLVDIAQQAHAAGLRELVAYALPHNRPSRKLFRSVFPGARETYEEYLVRIVCSLSPTLPAGQRELATAA